MISLLILVLLFLISLGISAIGLSASARGLRCPKHRIRNGIAAALLITGATFFISACALVLRPYSLPAVLGVLQLVIFLFATFFILQFVFQGTVGRTFALVGVYFAIMLLELALTVGLVRPYLVEAFVIPTASMSPTLEPGDRLIVNKMIAPRRWDLIGYWVRDQSPAIYCKRLVGLPGERLRFEKGQVYVNDKPVTAPAVVAGRYHASLQHIPENAATYRDGQTITLWPDEFFLIGDNVELSGDSRLNGPSKRSDLVGVGDVIYWPIRKMKILR